MKEKMVKFQELCDDYEQEIDELEKKLGQKPSSRGGFSMRLHKME